MSAFPLRHGDCPWACPICGEPLTSRDQSLGCDNGHRFDRAREGYVNLLPAQHKRSREPGDSMEMLQARRAFLEQGHYDFLVAAIAEAVGEHTQAAPVLLDAGCGEGYYLGHISGLLADGTPPRSLGVDIAKPAVRMAAKRYPDCEFAVASSYRLPLAAASVDLLLRVFAPGDASETARVLKPGGLLLVASPGPRHLFQLKQEIYAAPREHAPPNTALDGFELVAEQRLQRELRLEAGAAGHLLAMTPFFWRADADTQARLRGRNNLKIEVDFLLHLWRKRRSL